MIGRIKKLLYFPVAGYFRFFSAIRLKIWKPRIIVLTGSSGKTTLLHLIESQLGSRARYSHEANSSFGIPFDILDIHRKDLTILEWPLIFVLPWVNVFRKSPKENIYIVEADCDRPGEGRFLSSLLNPEVILWTNVSKTHSMNFESLVTRGKYGSIESAVAHEFGYFLEKTVKLAMLNADDSFIMDESKRATCEARRISGKSLKTYRVDRNGTTFKFDFGSVVFKYLLPRESSHSILMCKAVCEYLECGFDSSFSKFVLPPGRSSVFKGVKGITIVDSSYNANLESMKAIMKMFVAIKAKKKWVVLGDMLEQGGGERGEHEKLASFILKQSFKRIVLVGPRILKYTYPLLSKKNVVAFEYPGDVLTYLRENITGDEFILFKGARFLEGVIAHLLTNKDDVEFLARREKIWEMRRKKWGL